MEKNRIGCVIYHGFTSSFDTVNALRPPLEAHGIPYRMPSLRGHNTRPEDLEGVHWQDWVADGEAALLDLLTEVDRAVVMGHSMGGLVAHHVTVRHQARVAALVTTVAALLLQSPVAPGRPLAFLAPFLRRLIKRWDMPPDFVDKSLEANCTNYPWAPISAIHEMFKLTVATRPLLPQLHVPYLIVQARGDKTVRPASAQVIYDEISTPPDQKRLAWFEQTSHEIMQDCEREAVVATIIEFVLQARDRASGALAHG